MSSVFDLGDIAKRVTGRVRGKRRDWHSTLRFPSSNKRLRTDTRSCPGLHPVTPLSVGLSTGRNGDRRPSSFRLINVAHWREISDMSSEKTKMTTVPAAIFIWTGWRDDSRHDTLPAHPTISGRDVKPIRLLLPPPPLFSVGGPFYVVKLEISRKLTIRERREKYKPTQETDVRVIQHPLPIIQCTWTMSTAPRREDVRSWSCLVHLLRNDNDVRRDSIGPHNQLAGYRACSSDCVKMAKPTPESKLRDKSKTVDFYDE